MIIRFRSPQIDQKYKKAAVLLRLRHPGNHYRGPGFAATDTLLKNIVSAFLGRFRWFDRFPPRGLVVFKARGKSRPPPRDPLEQIPGSRLQIALFKRLGHRTSDRSVPGSIPAGGILAPGSRFPAPVFWCRTRLGTYRVRREPAPHVLRPVVRCPVDTHSLPNIFKWAATHPFPPKGGNSF